VDVQRAAALYAQGWTLRQIGARIGHFPTTVSEQLRWAGVIMSRGGPSSHPASAQQSWSSVTRSDLEQGSQAGRFDYFRCLEPQPEGPAAKVPRLGRWRQVLADALEQNLAIGVRAVVADHLGRAPNRAELTAARRRPTVSPRWVAPA
jgi:hypothetical protein